ncbi:MAG: glycine cleavage system protein GcvH [Desulfovibrio sp.]|jgi:glycine cleavage system H protein|nr:glycine cleavage system protein GcvH [Desulfovibrio sp.]
MPDTVFLPDDRFYTSEHVWVKATDNLCVAGISDFAQRRLETVVFVDLPDPGKRFKAGDIFGNIESVKSVNAIYMPVSGTVLCVNEILEDVPERINTSPYEDGWLIRIQPDNHDDLLKLLNAMEYRNLLNVI